MAVESRTIAGNGGDRGGVGRRAAYSVDREDTVIFDLDRTIKDPENFNWFTGTKRAHGTHQAMWEPLFIELQIGAMDPWLGLSLEPNAGNDVWTLKLREGVESDGEAFNADDVVFRSIWLGDDALSSREAATPRPGRQGGESRRSHRHLHPEPGEPALPWRISACASSDPS